MAHPEESGAILPRVGDGDFFRRNFHPVLLVELFRNKGLWNFILFKTSPELRIFFRNAQKGLIWHFSLFYLT
ncbi:hypothetical protein CRP01_11785 [Flavilitoribacter nigricans DSM 23189 = NBRC 102662]|uniref:Uncharacterized protein n=1 Tax=Flavilitoribacter nigricans (strain ATCC 23147 / DSM 23189 / NBRC 102662 / NCIMB 1420 / SS-2) TaxID=1122177 RepID=A0A2D0NCL9_FLAN2|nr:hypothetical protein CRP01_11785 [Flavilitoribacter nigricans DSM 23189 = NBRC 102662]